MFGWINTTIYLKDWKTQRRINKLQKETNDILWENIEALLKRLEVLETQDE